MESSGTVIFLLMASASLLGFLLSWVMRRNKVDALYDQIDGLERKLLKQEHVAKDLNTYIQALQGEKKNLIENNDELHQTIEELELKINQFEENKDFLYSEFSNYYTNSKQAERKITSQNVELKDIKSNLNKFIKERDLWENKCRQLVRHYEGREMEEIDIEQELVPGASTDDPTPPKKSKKKELIQKLQAEVSEKKLHIKTLKHDLKNAVLEFEKQINELVATNSKLTAEIQAIEKITMKSNKKDEKTDIDIS